MYKANLRYISNFSGIYQVYLRLLSDIASPEPSIMMPKPRKTNEQLARRKYGGTIRFKDESENLLLSYR